MPQGIIGRTIVGILRDLALSVIALIAIVSYMIGQLTELIPPV